MAITTATATFTGVEDVLDVTWPGITSNPPTVTAGICTSDGSVVALDPVDGITNLTNAGCTIMPTSRFVGVIELVIED